MSSIVKKTSTPIGGRKSNIKCPREKNQAFVRKPIVLSSQRYGKITNNAFQLDKQKAQQEAEEEQKYKDYLKAGNERLVAQFKGNMQRTQNMKLQQMREQQEKKEQQIRKSFEHTKENAQKKRREKIAEAQEILERMKPGPRELNSAVLQSEVLKARNVQRNINEEFEKAIKKQDEENVKLCEKLGVGWINDEVKRVEEQQKAQTEYKQEIMETILENQRQKAEAKKQLIQEQRAARDAIDQEIKAQIERERAIMEKKRAALRKNALEAMKMVEQRRLRDRIVEEMEDRLNCVYNTGKRQLDIMRADTKQKIMEEKQKQEEEQMQKLVNAQDDTQAIEDERYRRDISTMQLKFTAEEQEKIRREKAAKQARIEAYIKEMQEQKEAERKTMEEKRFDMANRYKNMEVNCLFEETEKQENARRTQEVRATLNEQIEERKRTLASQKQADQAVCKDTTKEKEHQFFFNYARNLMEDAQKKGRPLYPLIKVVQQYKRDNQIDCVVKTPKHLQTQINIGRQGYTPKNNGAYAINKTVKDTEKNSNRANIIQNCLKIDDIIAKEGGSWVKKGVDIGKCLSQCPYNCNNQYGDNSKSKNPFKKIDEASSECASAAGVDIKSGTGTGAASGMKRYSMQELKQLYQFVPPHKCF